MNDIRSLLSHLLSAPVRPQAIDSVESWWASHRQATAGVQPTVHRAVLGGFVADRLGYAFASGYREALCLAIPDVGDDRLCLCATEKGGAHPRAIASALTPAGDGSWRLSGRKEYASLGAHADGYIAIVCAGQKADGRKELAAVRIPKGRAGVTLEPMPPTPFIPEIPHARISFDDVHVAADERLPGDGYDRYLKPFRTVEDIHVQAALLGWLLQVGRRSGWPQPLLEEVVACIAALVGLIPTSGDPMTELMQPCTHIALAGLLAQIQRVVTASESHWATSEQATRERWQRDRPLLMIAGKARARRRQVAWQRATEGGAPR